MTLLIMMYGSYACKDTAVTRDRLNSLRIKFMERNKEDDESVVAILGKYNQGIARTPTLVFGEDKFVLVEPTLEQLEETLIKAGYTFDEPRLRIFNVKRYLPSLSGLPAIRPPVPDESHGISKTILFFTHVSACRVCQGYTKQIVAQHAKFAEAGARLQIVLRSDVNAGKKWVEEFALGVDTFVDVEGNYKRESADCFPDTWDIRMGGTWLLLVSGDDIVRAGVYAPDAGGLAAPSEIIRFLTEQK